MDTFVSTALYFASPVSVYQSICLWKLRTMFYSSKRWHCRWKM